MVWQPQIGVCSWSLQVGSVDELVRLAGEVGTTVVQVGLGDPNHGTWKEGEKLLGVLRESPLTITATMIGFPGEDYTSPATIQQTGGFGDPELRPERTEIFRRAVDQTAELGSSILCSHAGFLPEPGTPGRDEFLATLRDVAEYAGKQGVVFAMETGQETAALLRRTLDDLSLPSLKVNFDPANMILYDMGDPVEAVQVLGADIVHVHAKDARPPRARGEWGEEVVLGEGDVGMGRFVAALDAVGYRGPLCVEREVGDQAQRVRDIRTGVDVLRGLTETK